MTGEPSSANDAPTTHTEPTRRRRGRVRILVALIGLLALAVAGWTYWRLFLRGVVTSDDARVDAHLVDVAPQTGGTLATLSVDEGDHVTAGQMLFELEASAARAALARAEADADAAQARLDLTKAEYRKALHGPRAAEIRIALAARETAEGQAELAAADWQRTQSLVEKNVVPDAERLKSKTAWESAQRSLAEAEDKLKLLREGTRVEDIAAARANVAVADANLKAARAAVAQAQVAVDHCTVHAPFTGIVARTWREVGATVATGTPVLTLLDPTTLHVAANIDEKDLDEVSVGDRVDISVDAFPNTPLHGKIETVLRATNSRFGLVPAEGVSGTFIKVAQRMPLRIALDAVPKGPKLSPGLSVEVRIFVDHRGVTPAVAGGRD
jgi:membrane fusion protein (multidrug efflux system)